MDLSSPSLPPNVTPLTDGDPFQVGQYRLIGRLGADDLSTLYAAVSPDHEAMALKLAGTEGSADAEQADEADLVRRAGGVCALGPRDGGTHEGHPWSAIGYLPGFELQRYLRSHGTFGDRRLLALAAGLAEALATFHSQGLVHGDMRPGNVVVAADGPKVLDFGITRRVDPVAPAQSAESLGWLAPERYERAAATTATDVHGWAALVLFAATGNPPFGANPAGHVLGRVPGQIVWEMAARAREARVDLSTIPEDLRPLLEKAFSSDPERRPSAEEAYLECLLLLGIDEQATADTWPARLRALIAEQWPALDLSWHDPIVWTDAALALAERQRAKASPDPAPEQSAKTMSGEPRGPVASGPGTPMPGVRGPVTPGAPQSSEAAAYLFGGRGNQGHDSTAEIELAGLEEEEETAGGPRMGMWLGVGAVGMALVLGGGYLLYDLLSGAPADTVGAQTPTAAPTNEEQEPEPEPEPAAPEPLACDDPDRVQAQEAQAHWRPFSPEAATAEQYLALLTPGPEGVPVTDPEIWPFVHPVDHDTVDYGLATPSLSAFPVLSVCMSQVEATADGAEFTVEVNYHPNVGSHHVYAEDFMALIPIDPAQNDGVDRRTHRGGTGSEIGAPLTTLAVLSPQNPSEVLTVHIPGAPERAGVAYRPAAHSAPLEHEANGHCYDVDGTLEWRDEEALGSGFFAMPDTSLQDNTMLDCPAEVPGDEGEAAHTADEGVQGDAGGVGIEDGAAESGLGNGGPGEGGGVTTEGGQG